MNTKQTIMASIVAVAVFSIAVAPIAPSAFADQLGSNGKNWGAATAFLAQIEPGHMGEHSKYKDCDFADPAPGCTGVGNLKKLFDNDWCGLLDFLNVFSDEEVLTCSEQAEA